MRCAVHHNVSKGTRDTDDFFPIECPSLLTDRNQTFIVFRACAESPGYRVSRNSLPWKSRQLRKYIVLQVKCPSFLTNTKISSFVGHAQRLAEVDFQEIPWNEIRDSAYKVLCCSREVTFIIHRSHPNLHRL